MPNEISYHELAKLIDDDKTPDRLIFDYFDVNKEDSDSFYPELMIRPGLIYDEIGEIPNQSTAAKGLIGKLNRRARRKRFKKFNKKIKKGFSGTIIVSEGDSWFQYPLRLKDIIDHLSKKKDFAIYSLGFAGDWLSNILDEKEYLQPIEDYQAKIFLISGGGNDMLGKRRLESLLKPFKEGRPASAYFKDDFYTVIAQLKQMYLHLYSELHAKHPDLKIIGHGYDHAIPKNGQWLGKPMKRLGIRDKTLQREITRLMIDKFNDMRHEIADELDYVFHVDCRGLVTDWYDELHPKSSSFKTISNEFEKIINQALRD